MRDCGNCPLSGAPPAPGIRREQTGAPPRPAHDLPGALVNNELQGCSQRGLDGSAVDLTVGLHGMRVACVELRAVLNTGR